MTFNGGYQATDYVQIAAGNSVNASINASAHNVDLGNNTPVVFTANVSGATSYTWNFGDGTVLANAPANVSHTFTSAGVFEVRFEATNQVCTSTATTTVTAIAPSGIQNNTSEAVKVFGVENRVTVQFGTIADGKGRIEVLNMLGQNLISVDVASTKGTREIEVPNVAVGHYLVRVTTADKVFTQKVYLTK
jgi:PKD repeat protein